MGGLRLVSVLVGNVAQGELLAVGRGPLDRSAHGQGLLLGADVLQLGGLLTGNAIAGLVLEAVAVSVDLALRLQHNGVQIGSQSGGDHDGENHEHLHGEWVVG